MKIRNWGLLTVLAIVMASCGNKSGVAGSSQTGDTVKADTVETLQTEMAVEKRLKEIYVKVNEVWSREEVNQRELDDAFCTREYLQLKEQVNKIEEEMDYDYDNLFFLEYMPWTEGLATPVSLKDVKVTFTGGGMAEATFILCGADGIEVPERWALQIEEGVWKVRSFLSNSDDGGLLEGMRRYVESNKAPKTTDHDVSKYAE